VEDAGIAVFRFAGGACGALSVAHAAREAQDTLDIFGSQGSIHVATLNEGNVRVKTNEGERVEAWPPAANFHQPLIDDFTNAVLSNTEPKVGGHIGLEVNRIEAEIYRQ